MADTPTTVHLVGYHRGDDMAGGFNIEFASLDIDAAKTVAARDRDLEVASIPLDVAGGYYYCDERFIPDTEGRDSSI